MTRPGFEAFFDQHDNWQWHDPEEYRQRYVLQALEAMIKGRGF